MQYTPDGWTDVAVYLRPYAEDPDGPVAAWAKSFVAGDRDRTSDVLSRIMNTRCIYRGQGSWCMIPPTVSPRGLI